MNAGQRKSASSLCRKAEAVAAEPEIGWVGNDPAEPYKSIMKMAKEISYLKQPAFLKAAMSTTLLAVAEFHVQIIGLSTADAEANMAYTRERLVIPIEKGLDNPKMRNVASSKAIWFVRSTAQFFQEYFEGARHKPLAYVPSPGLKESLHSKGHARFTHG